MSSNKTNPSLRILKRITAMAVLSGCLAGCIGLGGPSDPVRFFTLSESGFASDSQAPEASQVLVGLEEVVLPSYLAGKEIAVRLGENEIRYSSNNRWAERPVHAVTRLLEHAIASRSERTGDVVSVPWPDSAMPERVVSIEILSMEAQEKPEELVKLRLQWELRSGDGTTLLKRGEYDFEETEWSAKDYAGLMDVFSLGLEQAAAEIAMDVDASLVD